jgi:hypothetical protein
MGSGTTSTVSSLWAPLSTYLIPWSCPVSNICVGRATFPRDCSTDYNDFCQRLTTDEFRVITHWRFKVQQKQESHTATEMASRRYLTVAITTS